MYFTFFYTYIALEGDDSFGVLSSLAFIVCICNVQLALAAYKSALYLI